MKKKWLLYVFVVAGLCSVLTGCGKDGDDPEPPGIIVDPPSDEPTWKDALDTYKAEGTRKLVLNAPALINVSQKTVKIEIGTGENAKLTLVNILPDDASVEVNNVTVTKTADNDYLFAGETTVGAAQISVKGTLTGLKSDSQTFTLETSRKLNTPATGSWKLKLSQAGGDVRFIVKTGDIAMDMMYGAFGPLLGGMLAQKVTDVNVFLQEDGNFDLNWTIAGEDTPTGIPEAVKQMGVSIPYFFDADGSLYLALDASLLTILSGLEQLQGIDINALLPSLIQAGIVVSKGDYIAFSLSLQADEEKPNDGLFYVKKETLGFLMPLVAPLFSSILEGLPEEVAANLGAVLQNMPEVVATAERFDIGIGFTKQ
jgi:hypothetical protein